MKKVSILAIAILLFTEMTLAAPATTGGSLNLRNKTSKDGYTDWIVGYQRNGCTHFDHTVVGPGGRTMVKRPLLSTKEQIQIQFDQEGALAREASEMGGVVVASAGAGAVGGCALSSVFFGCLFGAGTIVFGAVGAIAGVPLSGAYWAWEEIEEMQINHEMSNLKNGNTVTLDLKDELFFQTKAFLSQQEEDLSCRR